MQLELRRRCARRIEKKEALPEIGAPVLQHNDGNQKKSVPEKFSFLSTCVL